MSATRIQAVYRDTGVEAYRDNPFIEALPPLQESVNSAASLKSSLQLTWGLTLSGTKTHVKGFWS